METGRERLGVQVCHALVELGVDTVFGIPGVHNQELYRGIACSEVTHVLARHEQGAGFMADGYARATGKPGVAFVITGPGLTNILTPVGQAYSDSVPMLVIATCLDEDPLHIGRGRLHELKNQTLVGDGVADWCATATSPDAVFRLIARAFNEFGTKRARPKIIQIPVEMLGTMCTRGRPAPIRFSSPSPNPEAVAAAAEMLVASRRPVFLIGGGAVGAVREANDIVEKSRAAVFSTYAGRGIVPSTNRLNFGSFLARPESKDVIASADLVIAVGTEISQVDLWRDGLGHTAPMIRVNLDTQAFLDADPADLSILGDAGAFLRQIGSHLVGHEARTTWDETEVSNTRNSMRASCETARPGIGPVIDQLQRSLPDDAVIYSDMTQFAYVGKELFFVESPGRWHHPTGFGTLGYAVPAAIGGKVGNPDAHVIAVAGDYGFQYTMQELGTAAELGISLPVLIWDNGKLKEIEDHMISAQIPPTCVSARNPDFPVIAEAYGIPSFSPRSLAQLEKDLSAALAVGTTSLIHLRSEDFGG